MAAVQAQLDRLRQLYLDLLQLTAAVSLLMQAGGLALADLGIRAFLGEKWLGAAPVFRAYLVLWLVRTLLYLGDSLTSATGRTRTRLAYDLVLLPLFAAGTWFGLHVWGGIAGVAWTLAIVRLGVSAVYFMAILRILRLGLRPVLRGILPSSLAAAAMGGGVTLLRGALPFTGDAARLGVLVVIGVGIYAGVYYGLDPSGLRKVIRMVRDILIP
jgi:O-antigen/teichoic acid export membrane protein